MIFKSPKRESGDRLEAVRVYTPKQLANINQVALYINWIQLDILISSNF